MMRSVLIAGALLVGLASGGRAQASDSLARARGDSAAMAAADTAIAVLFGGWIDTYYAYDFNRPPGIDRPYTAQAPRHDEFNLNLAFVDATFTGKRVHGRLALQYGNSVQANFPGEPRLGVISGPSVMQFVQEAWAGYNVAPPLWIDGGVFLSMFGPESFISRDNWTYTRSLIGEFSPTEEAGVRATWQRSPHWAVQARLLNGWSIYSETNSSKALGVRIDWTPRDGYDIAYDGFLGNELPDSLPGRLRTWHEAIVQVKPLPRLQLRGTFDYGTQRRVNDTGTAFWRGWSAIARVQATPTVALAGRVENYSDPEQVIVPTNLAAGLRASGASLDLDVAPVPRFRWRTEFRYLHGKDAVFPTRSAPGLASGDPVLISSLGLTW